MTDTEAPSLVTGVRFGHVHRYADHRGWMAELWRASTWRGPDETAPTPFLQANVSSSAAGVLRGLHLHRRQYDYTILIAGRAFLALVDVRPMLVDPAARPIVATRTLGPGDFAIVPMGVAHGFLALEPMIILYLVTHEYDGTDEAGFAWNDPDAAVPWPALETSDGLPILSERDRSSPRLAELVARLRQS